MKSIQSLLPMRLAVLVALSLPLTVTVASLAGCGGGGGDQRSITASPVTEKTGTARATVAIQWPVTSETRLIPVASNGVRITITNAAGFIASQVIARPATGTTFSNLPPGALTVTATAHADAEGNVAPAQAGGIQSVTAVADEAFAINLTMNSTIDRLSVSQSSPSLVVGEPATFTVSALDAAGNMVLTSGGTYQWSSIDTGVALVVASGATATVNGIKTGGTVLNVTETESGKTIGVPVTSAYPIITTPTGLQYQDVIVGTGRAPVIGKRVAVYYKGTFKDGTVFDSRLAPASAFVFRIGVGQVIAGWDEGVAGMRERGVRKLFVPSELAYGAAGSVGGIIPPNTPIDFEVELLEIEPDGPPPPPDL